MTDKELMNLAMEVATGNLTVTTVNYDEFMKDEFMVTDHAWEPFEHYLESQYVDMIMAEYYTTLKALKKVRDTCKPDKEVVHSIFDNIGSCGECKFSKNSRNANIVRCSILNEQIKKATGFCDEFERETND